MAKVLSIVITYNSQAEIDNAKNTCPVCNYKNKKASKSSNYRTFAYITTHNCECNNCGSKWNVVTDEQDE